MIQAVEDVGTVNVFVICLDIESIHKLKITSKKYWIMSVKHKSTAAIAVLLKYVKARVTAMLYVLCARVGCMCIAM